MKTSEPETIADIAQMAGVSPTTVSRVINNSGYVAKTTREKVENILKATGFVRNMAATTLVTSRTHMVGLILPTFNNPVYLDILKGVNEAAIENGYGVVIGQRGEEAKALNESITHLASLNVDGIISTFPEYHALKPEEYLLPFIKKNFPLVQLGTGRKDLEIDSVFTDAFGAGFQVGRHLASLGHERVAIIGHQENPFSQDRVRGLKSAYVESGIGPKFLKLFDADMTKSGGYDAACEVFADQNKHTAIFALNDVMAIGALLAAEDRDIRIPEEISVIGIDGIDAGLLVRPRLSTFILPTYDMGHELFQLLFSRMSGSYQGDARNVEFHGRLAVRESTLKSNKK